jgi:putative ABC transport system permease protein
MAQEGRRGRGRRGGVHGIGSRSSGARVASLRLNDLLCVSVRQVLRHRRRYLGVILAISLGVASLITVVTMSRDVKKNFNRDLNLIGGVTVLRVGFDNLPYQRPEWFRADTIAAIKRLPGVEEVSLAAGGWAHTSFKGQNHGFMLLGVEEPFWEIQGFWPLHGRLLDAMDVSGHKREVVIGPELAKKVFGTEQVAGVSMAINDDLYRVAGVLGGLSDSSYNNSVFMPLTTAQDRILKLSVPNRIYVRVATWDDVRKVAEALPATIQSRQPAAGLRLQVFWERLKRVKRLAWWIEFFVYLAITATLVLGGVGIWNVMMAAVRSRTREIGLKKAMGAQDRDILAQFLSEALCLSVSAALVGVLLGWVIVQCLGFCIGSHPPQDLFLLCIALGLLFAIMLGVGAGLYPSIQASRMEVVSAIRYE